MKPLLLKILCILSFLNGLDLCKPFVRKGM